MNEKEKTRVLGGTTAARLLEVRLGSTSLYTFPIYIHIYECVRGWTLLRAYVCIHPTYLLPVSFNLLRPKASSGEEEREGGGADDTPLQDFTHVLSYQRSNLSIWLSIFFFSLIHQRIFPFFASYSLTNCNLKAIEVIDSFILIPTTGFLVAFCRNVARCLTRLFLP